MTSPGWDSPMTGVTESSAGVKNAAEGYAARGGARKMPSGVEVSCHPSAPSSAR